MKSWRRLPDMSVGPFDRFENCREQHTVVKRKLNAAAVFGFLCNIFPQGNIITYATTGNAHFKIQFSAGNGRTNLLVVFSAENWILKCLSPITTHPKHHDATPIYDPV
jgi:hypothetical protein